MAGQPKRRKDFDREWEEFELFRARRLLNIKTAEAAARIVWKLGLMGTVVAGMVLDPHWLDRAISLIP